MPDIEQIAATARVHIDNRRGSAASGFSPEARDAVYHLTDALAADLGRPLADWVVTRWIITRKAIDEYVAIERSGA
jgi:hypothetical protein